VLSKRNMNTQQRTIFSPSPIHFEVSDEAEMLKKVALMLEAMARPMSVLPVPVDNTGARYNRWGKREIRAEFSV